MNTIDGVEYDEVLGVDRPRPDIHIGSLIQSYYSGYHIVTRIEPRKNYSDHYYANVVNPETGQSEVKKKTRYFYVSPLLTFVKIFHEDFRKLKKPGKEQRCDAAWCRVVDNYAIDMKIFELKKETEKKIQGLESLREYTAKES